MIKMIPKTGQRWLIYGLILAGLAVFAWFQRAGNNADQALSRFEVPGGRHIASAAEPAPGSLPPGTVYYAGPMPKNRLRPGGAALDDRTSAWHEGNPILQRPIDVQMTEATASQVVTQIGKMTGLNLICFDAQLAAAPGHLSLHLTHVPAWEAMQAVANACGGTWRQENTVYTLLIPEPGRLPALRAKPMPMAALAEPM